MSTVRVSYEIEQSDGVVLLRVTSQHGYGAGAHSEGVRIPFDQIAEAIQALTSATWDVEHASSADETEKGWTWTDPSPLCEEPRGDGYCAYHHTPPILKTDVV